MLTPLIVARNSQDESSSYNDGHDYASKGDNDTPSGIDYHEIDVESKGDSDYDTDYAPSKGGDDGYDSDKSSGDDDGDDDDSSSRDSDAYGSSGDEDDSSSRWEESSGKKGASMEYSGKKGSEKAEYGNHDYDDVYECGDDDVYLDGDDDEDDEDEDDFVGAGKKTIDYRRE